MSACQAFLANLVPQFCQWIVIAHSDAGMLPSPTLTQSASPNSGSWLGRCADRCAAYCFLCVLGPEAWPIVFSALSSVAGPTWPTPRKPSSLRFWGSPGDPNFGAFFKQLFLQNPQSTHGLVVVSRFGPVADCFLICKGRSTRCLSMSRSFSVGRRHPRCIKYFL